MSLDISTNEENCLVKITGELTVYETNEFKAELMSTLEDFKSIEVDLGEVTELDSSGLQFLMALTYCKDEQGQSLVRITEFSEPVSQTLKAINLYTNFCVQSAT